MNRIATVTLNPALDKTIIVDALQVGKKNKVLHTRVDLGGKGINVARVLAHMGYRPETTGWKGTIDPEIKFENLTKLGIKPSFVSIPQKTRTNTKIIVQETGENTDLNEKGYQIDEQELTDFVKHYEELLLDVDLVVLAGSLPQGVPDHFYATLIEIAKQKNVKAFLDADGAPFAIAVESAPYAVKPNREELEAYMGTPLKSEESILEAGIMLMRKGIQLVVLSLGAEGAYFFRGHEIIRTRPPVIDVKSPVGAGDSMLAGTVVGVCEKWELDQLARFATAAGSATAAKAGTQLCGKHEIEQLLPQVQVQWVNKEGETR